MQIDKQTFAKNLKDLFKNNLNELKTELLKYEPITTLIGLFYYKFILAPQTPRDYNPNENPSSASLELIQALILKNKYKAFNYHQASQEAIAKIYDLALSCCSQFGWFNIPKQDSCGIFIPSIQNHTALVRGESYNFQKTAFLHDILSNISTTEKFGFELKDIIQTIEKDITFHFLSKDASLHKLDTNILLINYIQAILTNSTELQPLFPKCCTSQQIDFLLDKMSLKFGDLADIPDEHLFLENPVQSRPIISFENGSYFAGHLSRLFTNSRKIFENLLYIDENLKKQYREVVRPRYLEEKLAIILKKSFPNAIHLPNSEFIKEGKKRENDYTVIVGNTAIIFEAKASRFKESMYRGSDVAYKETYKKNIIYASAQANIFEEYIKEHTTSFDIHTKSGQVHIDPTHISRYIKFNVILDSLPGNPLDRRNILDFAKANQLEENVNPTFVIADLEIVADVLDNEILLIDYLIKKFNLNFNDDFPITMCDEMDLLGLYLYTGLNIEFDTDFDSVSFSGLSLDMGIDAYYDLKGISNKIKKPKSCMNERFLYIINKLYKSNIEHLDICLNLLKLPFADRKFVPKGPNQTDLLNLIENEIKITKKDKKMHLLHLNKLGIFLIFHYNSNRDSIETVIKNHVLYNNEYIMEFDIKHIHRPFTNIFRFEN